MENEGLVVHQDNVEVEVPGPRGSTRKQPRTVYAATGTGVKALADKESIEMMVKPSLKLQPGLGT